MLAIFTRLFASRLAATRLSVIVLSAVITLQGLAETNNPSANQQMWPGASYNQQIPSIESVLGYQSGMRISSHDQMLTYFKALEQAAPKRIKLVEYARSWENRSLIYVVISSEDNIAELDKHQANIQRLSDPRTTSKAQAEQLIKDLPASVWLGYGVHGNEISSTDAAMMTAYHLLAVENDPMVEHMLSNTLVFIDPLQNPDGRTRFTTRYYATVGLEHSGDRYSADQNEPWPRGRSNHYLFDMNRDWLAMTQPETKGRIQAMLKFRPQVVIDLHEMYGDQSYYFAPSARPINPHMTQEQIDNIGLVGVNNGKHFDQFGFSYFTREIFDAFYPGYGDSWPTFYGAAAATYEVASARGEKFRRQNGEIYTYWQSVQQHFVASISTIEATSIHREKLLKDYYQYQVDAINVGKKSDERLYVIPTQSDRAAVHRLTTLLAANAVEVKQATERFRVCGKSYNAGSYIVDSAQPRGRFVTTVMAKQVDIAKDFMAQQEARRARKLHHELYDVTAWSLPLMFNVKVDSCDDAPSANTRMVNADEPLTGTTNLAKAKVAYIVPWGDAAASRLLVQALDHGLKVKSADKSFVIKGKRYPGGSLVFEVAANDAQLHKRLETLSQTTGAIVDSLDTSWVTDGPSFGSDSMAKLIEPKVAIAWDDPTSSLSAGNTRFVIERSFGQPVTAIRVSQLSYADLSFYDVLILPSGYYDSSISSNIKRWVQAGGVLVTLGRATRYAADKDIGLLALKRELAVKDPEVSEAPDESTVEGSTIASQDEYYKAIENAKESPDSVPGVLAKVNIDQEHWLTAGVPEHVYAMVVGRDIYQPLKLADGSNVAIYAAKEELLASGYLWQENLEQLAYKPFLVEQRLGKGRVIGFTQDIAVRAYQDGLNTLLINSIYRAPAHTGKLR